MRCTGMASTAGALYTLGYTRGAAEPKAQRLANHSAETKINNIRFSANLTYQKRYSRLKSAMRRTEVAIKPSAHTSHPGGLSEHRHSLRVDFVKNIHAVRFSNQEAKRI
jgi:hypothetical protein